MKKQVLAFLFIILCASSAQSSETGTSEIENIVSRLKSGDFEVVQTKLIPLAEQGNARAQFNLGVAYMYGQGVPQSYDLAFYWTEKSAKQGFARAEMNLAAHYQLGMGVPKNLELALTWYQAATADPEVASRAIKEAESLKDIIYATTPKMTASVEVAKKTN